MKINLGKLVKTIVRVAPQIIAVVAATKALHGAIKKPAA